MFFTSFGPRLFWAPRRLRQHPPVLRVPRQRDHRVHRAFGGLRSGDHRSLLWPSGLVGHGFEETLPSQWAWVFGELVVLGSLRRLGFGAAEL